MPIMTVSEIFCKECKEFYVISVAEHTSIIMHNSLLSCSLDRESFLAVKKVQFSISQKLLMRAADGTKMDFLPKKI